MLGLAFDFSTFGMMDGMSRLILMVCSFDVTLGILWRLIVMSSHSILQECPHHIR